MKFMITTPIYYVNAPVHLGHAYASTACDVLARWRRLQGDEVFFLTGLDEHGGNVEKVAREHGTTPQAWVDKMAVDDREFFKQIGISFDDFIRTTEGRHRKATEAFWKKVAGEKAPDGKDNIYKGMYEGWYCRSCEAYYQETELVDGNCPIHHALAEHLEEETYFFHLSGYQEFFEEFFRKEEAKPPEQRFVVPGTRFNEVRGIIKEGLRDVSISRTKISWGFPVPGDSRHVIYVWFDALINYLTAIGYPDDRPRVEKFWPVDIHVIGKEIMRFHALLWPAMLKAAGLPLPSKIAVHGWWTVEGEKISKSRGNVVDPRDYAVKYSLDAVRYFLLSEIGFGADGGFSERRFIERYNSDLANDFGNLAHRTVSMAFRYLQGKVPRPKTSSPWADKFNKEWPKSEHEELYSDVEHTEEEEKLSRVQAIFVRLTDGPLQVPQFQDALWNMWVLIKHGNKYLDERAPWNQEGKAREETLGHVLELLEAVSWPLLAFMPSSAGKLRVMLGLPEERRGPLPEVFALVKGDPLFPRIETKGAKGEN